MVSQEFEQAAVNVKNLKSLPSNDELLTLYAYYKQATQEPAFDSAPKPGMFDLKGKAKYNEWKKVVDAGTTPAEAEEKYIAKVKELTEKYGMKE